MGLKKLSGTFRGVLEASVTSLSCNSLRFSPDSGQQHRRNRSRVTFNATRQKGQAFGDRLTFKPERFGHSFENLFLNPIELLFHNGSTSRGDITPATEREICKKSLPRHILMKQPRYQ